MPRNRTRHNGGRYLLLRVSICVVALVALSGVCATQANPPAPGQTESGKLVSLTVAGSKKFSSDQISAVIGLKIGSMVTRDDIQSGANRLSQLGPFATVRFRYGGSGTDVKLEYEVVDAPSVPVTFDNFPWLTDDEITRTLKSSVVLFDGTAPDHGTILDDMAGAVQKLLITKGVQGGVTHQLVPDANRSGRVQQFRVEGEDLTIASVSFSDSLADNDRSVHSSLANFVGSPFSRLGIELFEFEQIRPAYLAHGFLRVRFATPESHLQTVDQGSDSSRVSVKINIDPGVAYTWNGAAWTGNAAVGSAQLNTAVTLKPGDLADGGKIDAAWNRVRDMFGKLGFLDLKLDPVPQFDDAAKRVGYLVNITEGQQYRMGLLTVSGLSVEGERRIRDAWKIPEGSLFDQLAYDRFLDTGVKDAFTGFPAHYDKIGRLVEEDSKSGTVNVMLDFQ